MHARCANTANMAKPSEGFLGKSVAFKPLFDKNAEV